MSPDFFLIVNSLKECYGISVFYDYRRLTSLLSDYCKGEFAGEIDLIIKILREKVPQKIQSASNAYDDMILVYVNHISNKYFVDKSIVQEMIKLLLSIHTWNNANYLLPHGSHDNLINLKENSHKIEYPQNELPSLKNLRIGSHVAIEEKINQGTGKLTHGYISKFLTRSNYHPYGIKIVLEDGKIGRVKRLLQY
jgi:uncharacterized repeat protein (TIGR03833 family)